MDKQGQQATTMGLADVEAADDLKQHPDNIHHRDDLLVELFISLIKR